MPPSRLPVSQQQLLFIPQHPSLPPLSSGASPVSLPTAVFAPDTSFAPRCSTPSCIYNRMCIFSTSSLAPSPRPSIALLSSLSWRGHTQGSNETTQQRLQEACFHRPSWIAVTMEISTTVSHTCTDVVLSTCLTTNPFILKNLHLEQFVTMQHHGEAAQIHHSTLMPSGTDNKDTIRASFHTNTQAQHVRSIN